MSGPAVERFQGVERDLLSTVSSDAMLHDLQWFAGHGLRLAGTDGERGGARYIAEQMRAAGVTCELQAFRSWVSYGDDRDVFGPARVTVSDHELTGKIYAFAGSTSEDGVTGELVWVETGSPDDYDRLDVDVRGKIAVSRLSMDAPHGEPVRLAGHRGALAIIIVNWSADIGAAHTATARGTWGNPTPFDLDEFRIPAMSVTVADGELLKANLGQDARIWVNASREFSDSIQPVAEIPGQTDDFLLLYCHQDTFGGAGLTDNTTGVVGLMEVARRLQPFAGKLRRGVRIAWWSGHEMPYNGSTHYLDSHWDEIRDHCVGVVNADSWAVAETNGRILTWGFGETEAFARACADDVLGKATVFEDFDAREAEQSFWGLGVPSWMAFSVTDQYPDEGLSFLGGYWHTECDTIEYVDQLALLELTQIAALTALRVATADVLPYRYAALGAHLRELLSDMRSADAQQVLAWSGVEAAVSRFAAAAEAADAALAAGAAGREVDAALIRAGRHINPVIYTVAGKYGQDPSSASHLRQRIPGLRRAVTGLADPDSTLAGAWLTEAMRERNRTTDALLAAAAELERVAAPVA